MTIKELNNQVDMTRGIRGGWPKDIVYKVIDADDSVKVIISTTANDKTLKKLDPWGFAFLSEVQNTTNKRLAELKFSICFPVYNASKAALQYEALKRRLSYLALANDLIITIEKNNVRDNLYTWDEITKRPDYEKVRDDFKPRGDDDEAGRLEKDFQTYLFGKGLHNNNVIKDRTNERLALFGKDFLRIGKIKKGDRKGYKVEREFPTGVFREKKGKNNRILPTEYVDLVTINRKSELALIELKFDDPKLEVIPQVLNYALFFHAYRNQLTPLIDKKLNYTTVKCNLVTYLVSNIFHERFDKVFPFYTKGPLNLKKVVLGYMTE